MLHALSPWTFAQAVPQGLEHPLFTSHLSPFSPLTANSDLDLRPPSVITSSVSLCLTSCTSSEYNDHTDYM